MFTQPQGYARSAIEDQPKDRIPVEAVLSFDRRRGMPVLEMVTCGDQEVGAQLLPHPQREEQSERHRADEATAPRRPVQLHGQPAATTTATIVLAVTAAAPTTARIPSGLYVQARDHSPSCSGPRGCRRTADP